jgi:hypothetical protein
MRNRRMQISTKHEIYQIALQASSPIIPGCNGSILPALTECQILTERNFSLAGCQHLKRLVHFHRCTTNVSDLFIISTCRINPPSPLSSCYSSPTKNKATTRTSHVSTCYHNYSSTSTLTQSHNLHESCFFIQPHQHKTKIRTSHIVS